MNARSYKTVFSKRLGTLVAVGEHASSQGKANGASVGVGFPGVDGFAIAIRYVGALTASFALVSLVWAGPVTTVAPTALPTGGHVAQGAATIISTLGQSGAVMSINQSTAKAVLNWTTFDIGQNAKVNIVQPGADAVMLNRVTSANPSQILGQLNANGQVVLVNPNGVLFGKDGSVNASSFTASTLGITDANFMAGNNQFERNSSTAAVVNQGSIKTTGGYVALLGASVSNEGRIQTQGGTAYLAAAETVKIPVSGSGRIKLELSPSRINAAVANAKGGTLVTEGGQVYMQAAALNTAVASIIQSGNIDTTGSQGGAVHLLADGGTIQVDGSITANSSGKDEQGQQRKGGDIVIGRDEETGVLAKSTDVSGAKLESAGGFVETSGETLKTSGISVKAKGWLLDPTDINIVAAGTATPDTPSTNASGTTTYQETAGINTSEVLKSSIESAINGGTNVTITTANPTVGANAAGNITLSTALSFSNTGATDATLTLLAKNGITQNAGASITTNSGTSTKLVNVVMTAEGKYAGQDVASASSQGIVLNSTISTNGSVTLNGTNNNTGSGAGVNFASGSGITAATYSVTGTKLGTAANGYGVWFAGTSNLTSSGTSFINGVSNSANGAFTAGLMFDDSTTVTLDAGVGTLVAKGSNAAYQTGVRIAANGNNSTNVTTKGSVTLGSNDAIGEGFMLRSGVLTADSGALTILGKTSTGGGVSFYDTTSTVVSNNGASITAIGASTSNGNGVYFGGTSINAGTTGDIAITGSSVGNHGIYNSSNLRLTGRNITLTGTSDTTGQTGKYGIFSFIGPGAGNVFTAAGDINISGTVTGTGTGGGVGFVSTSWQSLVNTMTAGGSITLNGTNNASAANTYAAISLAGVQASATGSVTLNANTNNSGSTAINISSAGLIPGFGYQGGSTSLVSSGGNVLIQSNQGWIVLSDQNATTSRNISGTYVFIDNTGGSITSNVLTAGAGVATANQGVYLNDARSITATATNGNGIQIYGASTTSNNAGVQIANGPTLTSPNLLINGRAGSSNGVYTSGTTTLVASGTASIIGNSSSTTTQQGGVNFQGAVSNTATSGGINITSTDTAGGSNWAYYQNAALSSGTGGVTINVTGSGANSALDLYGNITTTGAVSLTGNAGVGGGHGIWTNDGGAVTISGTSVTMNGTGGTTGGVGAYLNSGTTITASTGDVSITGSKPSSASTAAINLAATINGVSTKNINLTGGLTGAGSIVTNGAAVNLNNTLSAADTSTVVISGTGSVNHQTGKQNLNGANTYTGATSVSAGTLSLGAGAYYSSGYDVSSGAVLNFNIGTGVSTAGATPNATSFTGAGTITKTGAGTLSWGFGAATFNMSAGGLIDVQAGTFIGGSSNNEVWTNNKSSLNVASVATFDTAEAAVRVDALTGAGTVKAGSTGWGNSGLTVGVNNTAGSSATFAGVIQDGGAGANQFIKTGAGTQILTGTNTLTGTTTISGGTLQIGNGSTTGTLGTSAVTVATGTNLNFYRSNALTSGIAISGAGNVNFLGTGVQNQSDYALSGNNISFAGTINLSTSRLTVTNASQVGNAVMTVNGGAGLYVSGNITLNNALSISGTGWNESIGYLGALRLQNNATFAGPITLLADARIGAHSGIGTVSGSISGAYNLEINTPAGNTNSVVYLTNTNAYTGTTTVNIGTLSVGNGGATGSLGATSGVSLVGGATLAFNKNVNTTIDKPVSGNGNVTANITGDLALTSTVALTGTNTINLTASGAITESSGSLAATNLYMTTTSGDVGAIGNRIQTNVTNLSLSGGGNVFLTEANEVTVAGRTTANNGSVDIATINGTMTIGTVNGISGITAHGTGDVNLTATASAGHGIFSNRLVKGRNITMLAQATATTGSWLGYYGGGGSFEASGTMNLTGITQSSGNGFYSFNGSLTAASGIAITGTSTSGQAVGFDKLNTITNSTGGITITGTATDANKQAIGLRGLAIINGGGNVSLSANNGKIFSDAGNLAWGAGAQTNTIVNSGTGTVQVIAGNGSATNSGSIDGSVFTITQNANAGVVVSTSGTGNLTAPKVINAGTGDVVLAAGSALAAGTSTGGQILTVAGNTVTQTNAAPGKTYVYSGAPASTGVLSNLTAGFSSLYYEGTSSPINSAFNQAYGATVTGGASAQVLFREASAPTFNLDLSTYSTSKTYGQADPNVLGAIQTALTGTNLTRMVAGVGGNNTFVVSANEFLATLAGARAAGENASVTPYAYSLSAGLNTTLTAQPTLTINKATITAALIGLVQKEYDGSTAATVTTANYNVAGWATVGGVTEGATLSQPFATYASPLVANNTSAGAVTATLQASNFTANVGTNLANYTLPTSASGLVGLITRAPLTVKVNNTAMFVTQDPNTAADNGIAYGGLKNGESALSVLGALTRIYTGSANPASGSYTGVYGLTTTPTANNYTVYVVPGNLTVARADQLLLNVGSTSATYGALTASNAGASATSVTAQYCLVSTNCNGANIANLTMNSQGAGRWTATDVANSTISFDTVVDTTGRISGAGFVNAGNYTFTANNLSTTGTVNYSMVVSGGVLTVDPKALTLNASNVTKVYDGTTALAGMPLGLTGSLTGDQVSVTSSGGTFGGKNVGNQSFSLTGLQLQGTDRDNYTFTANSVTGTGTITPKTLTLSASASDKAYDGTTSASVGALSVSGAIAGDTVSATGGTASFADKNVARDASGRVVAKPVTISGVTLTGADAGNYQADTGASVTATITPLTVNASVTAQNKVYDGTTQAQVSGTVAGTLGSDAVSVTSSSSTFASKNVVRDAAGRPSSQSVNVAGLSLTGADAVNYNLASTTATSTATITPKVLNASGAVADKVYDGSAQASLTGLNGSGIVAGDAVSVQASSAAFSDKNVARDASGQVIAKTVTVTGLSIGGADANNYELMGSSFTAQASILPRSLNVVATAQDKVYDGSTAATGSVSANNIVAGDALQLSWGAGSFASKDVSRNAQGQVQSQGVSFGNLQITGADVGNYSLTSNTASTTATISPKVLQASGTVVADKPEDGNTTAKVTVGTLVGLVGSEQLVATAAGSFNSATAGSDKPVSVSYSLQDGANGGRAGNYALGGESLKASILAQNKSNPVQPIIVPVKPAGGGSKVVVAKAQAAVALNSQASQNEGRDECAALDVERCECKDADLDGVEICIVPRERLTQADPARVSQLQVTKTQMR